MINLLTNNVGLSAASSVETVTQSGSGFWDWLSKINTLLAVLIAIGTIVTAIVVRTIFKYLKRVTRCNQVLEHSYSEASKEIEKYYIHTRGQQVNPTNYGEIIENNEPGITTDLLNHFMKIVFRDGSSAKYYLILADSGMGKTTFLVKLYKKYLCSFFQYNRKEINLIYLGREDCINRIKRVKNKENTILLLDALDEHPNISSNEEADAFLQKLLLSAEPFYRVVITCRSQFFPDQKSEPDIMPFMSADVRGKEVKIHKLYLSPFSTEDIKRYIKKKYRWYRNEERKRAYAITEKFPLFARPLVLSYLDDLINKSIDGNIDEATVYKIIIDAWMDREANSLIKDAKGEKIPSKHDIYDRLRAFTMELTKYMLANDNSQEISLKEVEEIAEQKGVDINRFSAQGRSLLNRNANGAYKFAHKSFYDYMVAYLYVNCSEQFIFGKFDIYSPSTYSFIFQMLETEEKAVQFTKQLLEVSMTEHDIAKEYTYLAMLEQISNERFPDNSEIALQLATQIVEISKHEGTIFRFKGGKEKKQKLLELQKELFNIRFPENEEIAFQLARQLAVLSVDMTLDIWFKSECRKQLNKLFNERFPGNRKIAALYALTDSITEYNEDMHLIESSDWILDNIGMGTIMHYINANKEEEKLEASREWLDKLEELSDKQFPESEEIAHLLAWHLRELIDTDPDTQRTIEYKKKLEKLYLKKYPHNNDI